MVQPRIFVGLGANLPSVDHGPPRETLTAALDWLAAAGLRTIARSRWYESAPVPISDQPWFVNAVAEIAATMEPAAILETLHRGEHAFGRVRGERNAARAIDLDLIAYGDLVTDRTPLLPHPRMHQRAFVLLPLRELTADWRHPRLERSLDELIAALPPDQIARPTT